MQESIIIDPFNIPPNCKEESLNMVFELMDVLSLHAVESPLIVMGQKYNMPFFGWHFSSAQSTVKTIDYAYSQGYLSDAYSLLRKFRDDFLQGLFIKDVMKNAETTIVKNMLESTDNEVERIELLNNWFLSKLTNSEKKKEIDTFAYKRYFTNQPLYEELFDKFFSLIWKESEEYLNGYVHGNGLKYYKDNSGNNFINPEDKKIFIQRFHTVFSMLFSVLILQDSICLHSEDYVSYLEERMTPPENSQYWVASIFTEYINEYFPKISDDLVPYLYSHQKVPMQFWEEKRG